MSRAIEILSPGMQTTIQDEGRFGMRRYGVPIAGSMDRRSAFLANALLGNDRNAPLLEITLLGPKLRFLQETRIALSGADLSPMVDGQALRMNASITLQAGAVLSFGPTKYGCRAYLAVAGGLQGFPSLGSVSMTGLDFPPLKKGNTLFLKTAGQPPSRIPARVRPDLSHFQQNEIHVMPGPEYDLLSPHSQKELFKNNFTIGTASNRMGYRLSGIHLSLTNPLELLTSAVLPGTVQLTPSGELLLLMRDAQTTGGYPRILQVYEEDLDILAQKKPMETMLFQI